MLRHRQAILYFCFGSDALDFVGTYIYISAKDYLLLFCV